MFYIITQNVAKLRCKSVSQEPDTSAPLIPFQSFVACGSNVTITYLRSHLPVSYVMVLFTDK